MTEEDVIDTVIRHMKTQFPKNCKGCGHHFASLRDYCGYTTPVGSPVVYDLEMGDLAPKNPLGSLTFSNCRCGTSLVLTSKGIPLMQYWTLVQWGYSEMRQRQMTQDQLLGYLRQKAHDKVMSEES